MYLNENRKRTRNITETETDFTIKGSRSAIDNLYLNEEFADITFIIDGERLPAHRMILAAQSEYFRSMLFGGLKESKETEITLHVPVEAFKLILKFLYRNEVELPFKDSDDKLNCDPLIEILALASEYRITDIVKGVVGALMKGISMENALTLLKYAELYELKELFASYYDFIDANAANLLQQETFLELPKDLVITLLQRDSFYAPESEIFTAVLAWQKRNPTTDLQLLWPYVRFPLLKTDFILKTVKPLQLFTNEQVLEMIANARNVDMHKNKRIISTKQCSRFFTPTDPEHREQLFYLKKIVPDVELSNKLLIDLTDIYTFDYIRFVIDQSDVADIDMTSGVQLDLYITRDYVTWEFMKRFKHCRPTLQHFTFLKREARGIRIDSIGCKMFPLHDFEVLNVTDCNSFNIATEAMGAVLNAGIPIYGHKLLATRSFKCPVEANKMAHTTENPTTQTIDIQFGRTWHISRIIVCFLSVPNNCKITFYHDDSCWTEEPITGITSKIDISPALFTYRIKLSGSSIECTYIECLTLPWKEFKSDILALTYGVDKELTNVVANNERPKKQLFTFFNSKYVLTKEIQYSRTLCL